MRPADEWRGPFPATRIANTYEAVLREPDRGAWKDWRVRFAIESSAAPRRTIELAYVAPPADGPPHALWIVTGAVTAIAVGVVLMRLYYRRGERHRT